MTHGNSVTGEFQGAFEYAAADRMRHRFLRYALGVTILQIVIAPLAFGFLPDGWIRFVLVALTLTSICGYAWAYRYVRRAPRSFSRSALVRGAGLLLAGGVLLRLPHALAGGGGSTAMAIWLFYVAAAHVIASVILEWRWRESLVPFFYITPVVCLYAFIAERENGIGPVMIAAIVTLLIAIPGTFIAWMLSSAFRERFRSRFLYSMYGQMKRELDGARQIHEDLFPDELTHGPVQMRFAYEPMREIGGDFVFVHSGEDATLCALIDVTGHGIGAALTVNRLHGELDRLLGECPHAGAGEVLAGLNAYIELTLSSHGVYATGCAIRVDHHSQSAEYANAGHPPAFLVGVDGTIERLDSTTFMLGVCSQSDFEPKSKPIRFGPGDRVLAYTDGATEARNEEGGMLGVMGLLARIAGLEVPEQESWPDAIMAQVAAYRAGRADDDTLVLSVERPL